MSTEHTYALRLTPAEAEWVLWQLRAPALRLFPSRFSGESESALRALLDEAERSMLGRGWIEPRDDGLVIDSTVAGMVGVLGFAGRALWASWFHEKDSVPITRRYYSVEGLLLEEYSDLDDIVLTALRDADVLRTRIDDHLGLKQQAAPTGWKLRCRADDFGDVPYILAGDGESAAIARLGELGADPGLSGDLISAMASPLWQATLQVAALDSDHPEGIRTLAKLVVLEGVYGIWAISTDLDCDPETVEIAPCSADQAKTLVGAVVDKLLN